MKQKSNIGKRIASLALCLLMALSFFPFLGRAAYAAGTNEISVINLTYNLSAIDLNTAWTEGQVNSRVQGSVRSSTTGVTLSVGSCGLSYFRSVNNYWGIGTGENQVDSSKRYALRVPLTIGTGYDLIAGAKITGAAGSTGLTIRANGADITDDCDLSYNTSSNLLTIYVNVGYASVNPRVTGVAIDGGNRSVAKGDSETFTGTVSGTVSNTSIVWSVSGNTSSGTTINSSTGRLTIGMNETANAVIVTATAAADSTKSASVVVSVLEEPPYISNVTVTPNVCSVYCGKSQQFAATVSGTQTDKRVVWNVAGATSSATAITDSGKLTVGADETASSLTVRATSAADPSKYGTAQTIVMQNTVVNAIDFSYDPAVIKLSTEDTEGAVSRRFLNNTQCSTTGVQINLGNTGLRIWRSNRFWGIYDGTDLVNKDTVYAFSYLLDLNTGYDWVASAKKTDSAQISGLTVRANGTDVTDRCFFEYNSASNRIVVYLLIGTPSEFCPGHSYATRSVTPAGAGSDGHVEKVCSICGHTQNEVIPAIAAPSLVNSTCVCDGNVHKPQVVVKDRTGKTISPLNYTLTCRNSDGLYEDSPFMPGTYRVRIDFKGNYSGTVSLTYTIVEGEPGLVEKDGHTMCHKGDGTFTKNDWEKIDGAWYHFDANGYMQTGWLKDGGKWYFLNGDGKMAANCWKQDSKGWCWLTAGGAMLTNGWAKDSKGWCWMGSDGYWVSSKWIKDGGSWYYIKSDHYMATSEWRQDSKGWCYLGASGKMVTNGWAKDSKGWCWMGSDGYWVSSKWVKDGGCWYYIKSNHYMATGTQTIGGKTYKFDSSGRWIQ